MSYFNFSFASLDDITFSIENNKIIRKKEFAQKNQKENLEKTEEKRKISVLKNHNYYVYIVKRGDNLFKISKKFGISIQKLIEINNFFEDSILYAGQKILIPIARTVYINGFPRLYAASRPKGYIEALTPLDYGLVSPVSGSNWGVLHYYNAIDIAAPCNDPVFASHDGVVEEVGYQNNGYGYYIILKKDDFKTLYGHLSKILVEQNARVNQGDLIGLVGKTGYATGCHLHFETRNLPNPLAD